MILSLKYYKLIVRCAFCVHELYFICSWKAKKWTELTSTYYRLLRLKSDKHEQKQLNVVLFVCFYAK